MLLAIRDKAQGWIAYAIVILISIPFALWGINEYFGTGGDPVVAEAEGVEITQRELDTAVQRYRNGLRERLGASYDPDMFPDSMVRQQVLGSMIRDVVISETAADLGLRAGNDMVRNSIRQVPAFQSNGQFDPRAYESALRTQGYSPSSFEERLRGEMATTLLERGITDGVLVTETEVRNYLSLANQMRDFSYVVVPAAKFSDGEAPTAEAIKTFYEENAVRFIRPERVKVAYLELSRELLADSLSVTEENLREYYDVHKAEFTAPEQRRVRHILIAVGDEGEDAALEQAQTLLAELRAGGDFAELAKTHSADPGSGSAGGDLGLVGRGVMVAPFEESAFSLEPGVISEPVKSQFGYHLIEVTEVVPEHVQSLEEARDRIATSWRQDEAERLYYDQAERLADLSYENPGSLEVAADALALQVQESDWVSSAGGMGGVLDNPKVLAAAFSEDVLVRGNNSDAIELDATHMLVLRTMEHEDAAPKPLDEVREEIVATLNQQRASEAAKELADNALAEVQAGEDLASVAALYGLSVMTAEGLVRTGSEEHPPALVRAVFTAGIPVDGKPVIAETALGGGDRAVFVLDNVVNADTASLSAEEIAGARAQISSRRAERTLAMFVAQQRAEASVSVKEPITSEE